MFDPTGKENKKLKEKGYAGFKLATDNGTLRATIRKEQAELATAHANSQGKNTNAVFAAENEQFRKICQDYDIKITARQASKYRNSRGRAYRCSHGDVVLENGQVLR